MIVLVLQINPAGVVLPPIHVRHGVEGHFHAVGPDGAVGFGDEGSVLLFLEKRSLEAIRVQ
jgi:hypothetical protein